MTSNADYEDELQSYISSIPFVTELKASPDVEISRTLFKMKPEHKAVHLTHQSLATPDTIPIPPVVFSSKKSGDLRVFYRLGSAISGHHNVVHGGLSATLLDEVMGIASYQSTGKNSIVTAELTCRYRIPVPTNTCVLVRAEMVKAEGRKVWMKGFIEDPPTGRVMVEAEALFMEPRKRVSPTEFE